MSRSVLHTSDGNSEGNFEQKLLIRELTYLKPSWSYERFKICKTTNAYAHEPRQMATALSVSAEDVTTTCWSSYGLYEQRYETQWAGRRGRSKSPDLIPFV
jgi:hypothetical protein